MDIEEYYFRQKQSKQRKFEGSSRRKGSTIRGSGSERHGSKGTQEIVTKFIKTTADWDEKRINDYCRRVLHDGGTQEDKSMTSESAGNSPANIRCNNYELLHGGCAVKKKKRWHLRENLRQSMWEQIHLRDETAPDITIIERTERPKRQLHSCRPRDNDVTRATFTTDRKDKGNVPRCVVDRVPNKTYSYTTDLMGYSAKKKDSDEYSKNPHRPEVMYEFLYVRNEGKNMYEVPPQKTKSLKYARNNTILEQYYDEIGSDDEFLEENYDQESEKLNDVPPKNKYSEGISLELFLVNPQNSKKNNKNAESLCDISNVRAKGVKPRKGNLIRLSENESEEMKIYKLPNASVTEAANHSIQIKSGAFQNFHNKYTKDKTTTVEEDAANTIQFANTRPITFVASFGEANNIPEKPCHLLFQTNYNPNTFASAEDTDEESKTVRNLTLTVLSKNKEFNRACNVYLKQAVYDIATCINDAEELEVFIACARSFANSIVQKYFYPRSRAIKQRHNLLTGQSVRECRTKRLNRALRGIATNVGVKTEYISLFDDEIMESHEVEEELGYEFVPNYFQQKTCGLCGVTIEGKQYEGFALDRCRHWFCYACWTRHTTEKLSNIGCPNTGCNERANEVARLLLWNLIMANDAQNDKLNSVAVYDCPNCNGLTKMTSPQHNLKLTSSIVTCACGTARCIDCENGPHWPVSCKAAAGVADEIELVRRKEDFKIKGKICPNCSFFVVKDGGCNNMSCFCGTHFCWRCLVIIPNRTSHSCGDSITEQQVYLPTGHAVDIKTAETNQYIVTKHIAALSSSDEIGFHARIRAMKYLSTQEFSVVFDDQAMSKLLKEFGYAFGISDTTTAIESENLPNHENRKLMRIIEDLLLVKIQLHFVIPFIRGAFTYGGLQRQVRNQARGILKKMENLCSSIEWLLLARDYKSDDNHFPDFYKKQANMGRKLIKEAFEAFHNS